MKLKKSFICMAFFIVSMVIAYSCFAQYAFIVGKRAQLNGPFGYKHLGVALDKHACDYMILKLQDQDQKKFEDYLLSDHRIMRIENNSPVLVLITEVFEGKAHIVLYSSFYRGMSGWVPVEWLDGNEERPRLSKIQ
jgi:hypothetical protein